MPFIARVWFAVLLLASATCSQATTHQNEAWVSVTGGVTFSADPIRFALAEARKDAFRYLTVGAAVAYLDTDHGSDELQLRLTATSAMTTGRWNMDWRQMLSVSSQDVTRLRSRLRVIRPGLLGHDAISLRAFDELFVDLEGAGIIRNNIAAGIGVQLRERCSAELYHVWVDNRVGRQSDYALLLFTLRF